MFGRKKAVERKDLEFLRILVQHLSARRVTVGVVQSEGRLVFFQACRDG